MCGHMAVAALTTGIRRYVYLRRVESPSDAFPFFVSLDNESTRTVRSVEQWGRSPQARSVFSGRERACGGC